MQRDTTASPVRPVTDLQDRFASIGINQDYSDLDFSGLQSDLQGWGSTHRIFTEVLTKARPQVVIEVGTWKGASVLNMRRICQGLGLRTKFICVDTWLGSNEGLWTKPRNRQHLMLRGGYPSMFRQFIYNITEHQAETDIFPMPMTSSCGFFVLKKLGITADVIYIDAGHEEEEVLQDLNYYYDLLNPGGIFFGDDYAEGWPGVIRAVNLFAAERSLPLYCIDNKWSMKKPQ